MSHSKDTAHNRKIHRQHSRYANVTAEMKPLYTALMAGFYDKFLLENSDIKGTLLFMTAVGLGTYVGQQAYVGNIHGDGGVSDYNLNGWGVETRIGMEVGSSMLLTVGAHLLYTKYVNPDSNPAKVMDEFVAIFVGNQAKGIPNGAHTTSVLIRALKSIMLSTSINLSGEGIVSAFGGNPNF